MSQAFVGEIKLLGFGWAPRGFMQCVGQALAINSQQALFSLLGTIYGGDGTQTFKLPDLRSRVAVGQGQGTGLSFYQMGQAAGTESTTIGIPNLPAHNHSAVYSPPTYTAPTYTPPTYTQPTVATTINAYTAPTARQISPANALLTAAQDTAGVPVNAYSTAGTAATLASGAATTTLSGGGISGGGISGGGISGGSIAIGATGSGLPFNNVQPYLAINYVIAIEGIYPSRN